MNNYINLLTLVITLKRRNSENNYQDGKLKPDRTEIGISRINAECYSIYPAFVL